MAQTQRQEQWQAQQSQTIQMEAFNTDLHGARILMVGAFPSGKVPPIMDSIQRLRDPFKKKVLLTTAAFSMGKTFPCFYDATFQAKDSQDWQMILTYLTYAPKPLLVVAEEVSVPDGLWQKMNRSITFIHQITKIPSMKSPSIYDAIFFAPMEDIQTAFSDSTYKLLHSIYRANYTPSEHKEILNELRVAGAGIAWSTINEKSQGGSIYWYDVTEHGTEEKVSTQQLADLFSWLARHYRSE